MFEGIIAAIVEKVASVLIDKIDEKLTQYFHTKAALTEIGKQAGDLQGELNNAQSISEYKAILRKIDSFANDLGKFK